MKRILLTFFTISCLCMNNSYADAFDLCMTRIFTSETVGKEFRDELSAMIGAQDSDTPEEFSQKVISKKNQIKDALVGIMFNNDVGLCKDLLLQIAKIEGKKSFTFRRNDKNIEIRFDIKDLLNFYPVATGIVISKDRFYPLDVIRRDYIKKKTWGDGCSNYLSANPFDSVYDNDPVNLIAQKLSGSAKNEFFLDEPEHLHAFPGLLIVDVTYQDAAELLIFSTIPFGMEQTEKFARDLKGTQCSGQGLNAYYVSYFSTATSNNTNATRLGVGFAVGGVAGASIFGGIYAGVTGANIIAGMFGAAASSATVPMVGWIVGAVIAVVAGVVALVSATATETIADIPQVTVLDGPFPI